MAKRHRGRTLQRAVSYPLEAGLLHLLLGFFRLFPLERGSALGGRLLRWLGPRLPVQRTVLRNLAIAFPEMEPRQAEAVALEAWDNLGRIAGEYPHLPAVADPAGGRLELVGVERLVEMAQKRQPAVLVAAHLGNFEIVPMLALALGLDFVTVVRLPNNPRVTRIITRTRGIGAEALAPKGPIGVRRAVAALKRGGMAGFLIDHKINEGVEVPFFGQPAMTLGAPAQIALRHGCPLIPVRLERLGGVRFRVTCEAPIEVAPSGDEAADVKRLTAQLNDVLEGWIRARPGQWFWPHRRWPRRFYET